MNREERKRWIVEQFELHPLELGHSHPVEVWFKELFEMEPCRATNVIYELEAEREFNLDLHSDTIAQLLRCAGRIPKARDYGLLTFTRSIIIRGDVHLQSAAVQALEMWGGKESLEVLEQTLDHIEGAVDRQGDHRRWLYEYVCRVIEDLETQVMTERDKEEGVEYTIYRREDGWAAYCKGEKETAIGLQVYPTPEEALKGLLENRQ